MDHKITHLFCVFTFTYAPFVRFFAKRNGHPVGCPFSFCFRIFEGFEPSVKQTVRGTVCSGDRRILQSTLPPFDIMSLQNSRTNPSSYRQEQLLLQCGMIIFSHFTFQEIYAILIT